MTFYNIYIYIFLTLFCVYFILKRVLKNHQLYFKGNPLEAVSNIDFIFLLDRSLKNNNISFSFFILLFYITIAIVPFIYLRTSQLGFSIQINLTKYPLLESFISLFFFSLSLIYFFKILNYIIYTYMLQIHFYLYYRSEKYQNFISNMVYDFLSQYISKIFIIFYNISMCKKEFIKLYKSRLNFYKRVGTIAEQDVLKNKMLFYLYLRSLANKYFIFKLICQGLSIITNKLIFHSSKFVAHIPSSFLIFCLGYDFSNGTLYYTFYALFFYYFFNIIKKIRRFFVEKDPVYDNLLSKFFYNTPKEYDDILKALKENSNNLTRYIGTKEHLRNILYYKEELINYINSDYKVYYFLNVTRSNTEKYIENIYKRLHLILLLLLFNIYMIYYNKYILICYNVNINLYFISILILCILYFIHRKIAEELPEYWVEHKTPKRYFYIIVIFYIIICSYLFLRNKLGLEFVEILYDYNNIVIIKENFTLAEKYKYIENYISQLQKETSVDWDLLEHIKIKIKNELTLTPDRTLEEIKLMINSIYESINQQYEKEIQAFNWYEWLKTQIKNKKS